MRSAAYVGNKETRKAFTLHVKKCYVSLVCQFEPDHAPPKSTSQVCFIMFVIPANNGSRMGRGCEIASLFFYPLFLLYILISFNTKIIWWVK